MIFSKSHSHEISFSNDSHWQFCFYHSLMASKIPNFEKKRAFTKVTTSSGVVGIVASEVPLAALEGLYEKLLSSQSKLIAANSTPDSGVPETTEEYFLKEPP